MPQLIEVGIVARRDHAAFAQQCGRLSTIARGSSAMRRRVRAGLRAQLREKRRIDIARAAPQRRQARECVAQLRRDRVVAPSAAPRARGSARRRRPAAAARAGSRACCASMQRLDRLQPQLAFDRGRAAGAAASDAARGRPSRWRCGRARRAACSPAAPTGSSRARDCGASPRRCSSASSRCSRRRPRRCGSADFCVSRTYCSRHPAAPDRERHRRAGRSPPGRAYRTARRARASRNAASKCQGGRGRIAACVRMSLAESPSAISSSAGRSRSNSAASASGAFVLEYREPAARELEPGEPEALTVARERGEQRRSRVPRAVPHR